MAEKTPVEAALASRERRGEAVDFNLPAASEGRSSFAESRIVADGVGVALELATVRLALTVAGGVVLGGVMLAVGLAVLEWIEHKRREGAR